jgi:hypothetical protein
MGWHWKILDSPALSISSARKPLYHTIRDGHRKCGVCAGASGVGFTAEDSRSVTGACCGRVQVHARSDEDLAENGLEVNPRLGADRMGDGCFVRSQVEQAKGGSRVLTVGQVGQPRASWAKPLSSFGMELAIVPICVDLSGNGRYVL